MMTYCEQIETNGFAIVEDVITMESVSSFIEELSPLQEEVAQVSGGIRNLMRRSTAVARLAQSDAIGKLVTPILGSDKFPVRAIFFDKTPEANWKIPWHQDVTIAVKERNECEGYGPWSVKAGVTHVQPPAAVSEQMLAVRIHLDDCPASNGALRVIPGTHRLGKLRHAETDVIIAERESFTCAVKAAGALIMRPLLLHASSESDTTNPLQHRRVIHLDYAATSLPCGLEWFETAM
jgi:ectoine hydroxylase-related dioxygenase (phytanoyl-CoA dioxygenase family)